MFFRRKNRKMTTVPTEAEDRPEPSEGTVLGSGWQFKGRISGKGRVVLRSTFEGELKLQGKVVLESSGTVKGSLRADEIRIGGSVEGDLESAQGLVLDPSAQVEGDVTAPRLAMATGARLNGRVAMDPRRKTGST